MCRPECQRTLIVARRHAAKREVLERLEQWYDIHFTVDDPSLLSKIISGKFRQSDQIETILKAISRADLFEYKILSQREITIY